MMSMHTYSVSFGLAAMLGASATSLSAADLEFYFPVGVNAPAVETIQALTDEWATENPQHTVKAIYAGNYEETTTKALTAANAGQAPQVAVLLSIDLFTLIEEEVVLPISDLANTAADKEWIAGFYPGFMKDAQFEGKTYAIPFQRSTPVFYYNKDAFREAGLDPEAPPTSWDEMIELGKALTVKDENGNVTRWGTRIPTLGLGGAWLFGGLVVSKGDVLTTETGIEARIDTPATVASLEFLLNLAKEGVMAPGGITWGDTPKAFLEGQTASMWTSTGNLAFIEKNAEFDWGVGFLPGGDGPGAPIGGGNFYIFEDTTEDEREAAMDFIKFPEPSRQESIQGLLDAQKICFSYGLTTVDDAGLDRGTIELIDDLQKSNDLKMRIYAMVSADKQAQIDYYINKGITKTDRLNVRSFKVYGDGA